MAELSGGVVDPELDLDFGDEGLDPNADAPVLAVVRFEPSGPPPYADGFDWATCFREYREQRAARVQRVDAGGGIRGVREGILAPPAAVRRLLERCEAAGFAVRSLATVSEIDALRYVGQTDDHDPGDERTPGHLSHHWFVQAVLEVKGTRLAAFSATWERREVGAKPGNKFLDALCWDIATGRHLEGAASDFEEWLAIFAPKPEPKRPAKGVVPLSGGDGMWAP